MIDNNIRAHFLINVCILNRLSSAIYLLLCLLWVPFPTYAEDSFQVERMIRIGRSRSITSDWSVSWSPDGTKIAYFDNSTLIIADTTGHLRSSVTLDGEPKGARWIGNSGIVTEVYYDQDATPVGNRIRMVFVSMKDDSARVIREGFFRLPPFDSSYHCPWASSGISDEGTFYIEYFNTDTLRRVVFDPISGSTTSATQMLRSNHYVRISRYGIFLCSLDDLDSSRISRVVRSSIFQRLDPNRQFLLCDDKLIRLADDSELDLSRVVRPLLANTKLCETRWGDFNPKGHEILGSINCRLADWNMDDQLVLVNYVQLKIVRLDPLIGLTNCKVATFSPDGKMIALWANDSVYVAVRADQN